MKCNGGDAAACHGVSSDDFLEAFFSVSFKFHFLLRL